MLVVKLLMDLVSTTASDPLDSTEVGKGSQGGTWDVSEA